MRFHPPEGTVVYGVPPDASAVQEDQASSDNESNHYYSEIPDSAVRGTYVSKYLIIGPMLDFSCSISRCGYVVVVTCVCS